MNILFGLVRARRGRDPAARRSRTARPARATRSRPGIGMVHQHFMLVPTFTVAENIVLGAEPTRPAGCSTWRAPRAALRELSRAATAWRSTRTPWSRDLPVGVQQRVEILKALYRGADILILDEPTAVLAPPEAEQLFAVMRELAAERPVDHLHHPQAARGACGRRPDHGAAPRAGRRHGPRRPRRPSSRWRR